MLVEAHPLTTLADDLRLGRRDLHEYIDSICDRIEQVDGDLQSLLPEADRRARLHREADDLYRRFPDLTARPALFGVLLGVKDIFRVDGFETRAGSKLPPALFAGVETAVVSRLKQYGALVLGKTVTTEFAFFEPGPTRNPHDLERTPGGSSSGSAAAVAAGLSPLALGTQTVGSVIRPAAYCGVVGYKPSYDRIDPAGLIFVAPSLDHVGLFTQDVAGMQLAAALVCRDWQPHVTMPDSLPVLGVPEGAYLQQTDPAALGAFVQQVTKLASGGFGVEHVDPFEGIEQVADQHFQLMAYEMADTHADWFTEHESRYRPRTADLIRTGQQVTAEEAVEARMGQRALRSRISTLMDTQPIDIWISPAAPGVAPRGIASTGDPKMNLPWTYAGLPTITVPAGTDDDGLPLGLQMTARYMDDERLLQWAAQVAAAL